VKQDHHRSTALQTAMFEAIFEFEQSHLTDNVVVLDCFSIILARALLSAGRALELPDVTVKPLQIAIWNYQRHLSAPPII
jgi:hypothetical protein